MKRDELNNIYKKQMKKHKGNRKAQLFTTLFFGLIVLVGILLGNAKDESNIVTDIFTETMKVHYIDVGQGDSTLIQVNNQTLLIDAGPRKASDTLVKYIKDLGITKINHVIASHPHEDHIGGMESIFKEFEIENFYSPKVTHTTKTYEKMINAVANEGLKIKSIKAGDGFKINLGANVKVEIYSPVKDSYEDLNNYSPIMKIAFGNNSFMFTGDAEKDAEKDVINLGDNLKADVLKIGHHGSTTSSSEEFINKVNPEIAVIPVGEGNDYGHPHKEILDLLNKKKINVLRTDKIGSIIIESDGDKLIIK